jgi:hypothetical protein
MAAVSLTYPMVAEDFSAGMLNINRLDKKCNTCYF